MLTAYLKGVAAVSTAGLLLFGAGSAARADLGPPSAPVDQSQAQQPAPDPGAYAPVPSQSQNAPGTDARDSGYGPSTPQRHDATPQSRQHSTTNDTVVTPAPPSSATANVIQVNPLDTCLSCTSASAGSGSASSHATALRLLGNDISAGKVLSGTGKDSGALLAIPANPLLYLALLDWEQSTNAGATSTAHSRAALLDLAIGPTGTSKSNGKPSAPAGAITVAVLEATSDAGYQGLSSNGAGSNNGVDVNIGQGALVIILLHSDASSSNKGSAYVLGINGAQILSSDQTGGNGIPIAVPGVVGLVLLQVGATGGNGAPGTSGAAVGTVSDLLGQSGQQAGVLTASAVGLTGLAATPNAGTPPATGAPSAASGGNGGLSSPNTGAAFGLGGLLLLLGGAGMVFASLRRRQI
ncbi:MAG TPA: hypothetical protein VH134_02400 [Candidatus Dormibacteraeota bacterium]|nr:hypothetical protein [Candidatus Dormibacteraeota bacterium]